MCSTINIINQLICNSFGVRNMRDSVIKWKILVSIYNRTGICGDALIVKYYNWVYYAV